jgi:tetratricopeptide (TPR) repeat protein
MKCANCGAELKVGCIYCSVCGKEAQIVSDYNLLEDDFLRDMLKEREDKIRGEAARESHKKQAPDTDQTKQTGEARTKQEQAGRPGKQKRRVKKRLVFAVVAIILLIILIVMTALMVNHSRDNSFDYQMEQARICLEEKDYRAAENYAAHALQLEEDSLEAKLLLADIYVLRGEEQKAAEILEQVCKIHTDNQEAYQKLIDIYDNQKDYQAILKLSEAVVDENVLQLFLKYLPDMPEFDMEEGVYTQEFSVGLSVEEGNSIYYTLDGTDPRQGREYQEPIFVGPGQTVEIRAIARNGYEIYSDEITGKFVVELQKPGKPGVSPSGGSFYEAQDIVVTVPEGCRVYYTWDCTTPTESSAQYTKPIAMPEGNNILSLIVVDKYGMSSDVFRCNYIYIPPA